MDYRPDWFDLPCVQRAISVYRDNGAKMCFAGGAVRDALFGLTPRDFDIVTPLPANESVALFRKAGLDIRITDEHFGTLQTVIDGYEFDIATMATSPGDVPEKRFLLRVYDYVRQYDVTVNGVYLTPNLQLHDHFGGVDDIRDGRVRFIGDPMVRVRERPNRILRFVRFHARFGRVEPDEATLAAFRACGNMLPQLRGETIAHNMFKLLALPDPCRGVAILADTGVLGYALGFAVPDYELLRSLQAAEAATGTQADADARFIMLLLSSDIGPAKALAKLIPGWRLSAEHGQKLVQMLERFAAISDDLPDREWKALKKSVDGRLFKNLVLMRLALEDNIDSAGKRYGPLLAA